MTRKYTMLPRLFAVCGLLAALALPASAQEEGADILADYNNGAIRVVPQEPGTPVSALFERTMTLVGSTYINDTGFDVSPGFDADPPYGGDAFQFNHLTIQQVNLTPGLTGIYQFDGVTKTFGSASAGYLGQWTLSKDALPGHISAGPGASGQDLYFHQHFDFTATRPGDYYFDFRYVNAQLVSGAAAPDSSVFRIHYLAPAAVPEASTVASFGLLLVLGTGALIAARRRSAAQSGV